MNHGRQLRLFLADGTSSGPRFYEIVNRTIQSLGIPTTRIKELVSDDWPEFQKPGVYLVHGETEASEQKLYIGRGENVAKRVQEHPEKLEFDVTTLVLFTSKDENLNASQVGWLEASLVRAAREAKRVSVANVQTPEFPKLPKAELATVQEFFEDLKLIAQTAGYDFFSLPKSVTSSNKTSPSPEFIFRQPTKNLIARGFLSDEGFVVKAGSDASAAANESFKGGYADLRQSLLDKNVLISKSKDEELMTFTVDYVFKAPSAAASVIAGNNMNGRAFWKTSEDQSLGQYQDSLTHPEEPSPSTPDLSPPNPEN